MTSSFEHPRASSSLLVLTPPPPTMNEDSLAPLTNQSTPESIKAGVRRRGRALLPPSFPTHPNNGRNASLSNAAAR